MTDNQAKILTNLNCLRGRAKAINGKTLAWLIYSSDDNKSVKLIQKDILQLRRDGYPICAADKEPMGYYIPLTVDEADSFFYQCKARARSTFITVANVAKGLKRLFPEQEYQLKFDI